MQADYATELRWSPERPNVLVVACSDGRLQDVTDDFLRNRLGIVRYDRFYTPGGAGALAPTGRDFMRARQMRHECRYLIDLHKVEWTILLFHSPTRDGPVDAMCADYRRKIPWASMDMLRDRQLADAQELRNDARDWAGESQVDIFRCEIDQAGAATFVTLD
jgi:hypothetical protein